MDKDVILSKFEIMDKECRKSKHCEKCKVKHLCDKYCKINTPRDMIDYLKIDLTELEFEDI